MSYLKAAQLAIPIVNKGAKEANKIVQESLGYDFSRLIIGLGLIFIIAKAIETYVILSTGVDTIWKSIVSLFGIKIPNNAPAPLVTLVATGYSGIGFWDIIKGLMILIVILEWSKNKERLTYVGHTVFGMLGGFLILITLPSLSQKLKEMKILSKVA